MWKETTKRYIVFLDILGFTDFVYRKSHSEISKRMSMFQNIIKTNEKELKTITKDVNHISDSIRISCFSDSVVIITCDNSKKSLENILYASQAILTACISNKIPIKGAISHGMITADFDKSLFYGEALIDAYNLCQHLHMYGIILDEKVELKISYFNLKITSYCIKSRVPTKSGLITHFAIIWNDWLSLVYNENALNVLNQMYVQVSGPPRKYLDNTIDFVESILNKK